MAFIPVLNTAQVEVISTFDSQRVQNVLHYEFNASITETDLTNLATYVRTYWQDNILPLVSEVVELDAVVATDLTSQIAPGVEIGSVASGGITVATAEPLPNNVALVFKKLTAYRGRSYRGRLYHYGLTVNNVAGNVVAPAHATLLVNSYTGVTMGAGLPTGWTAVIVSRYMNNLPREAGITTPITAISTDGIIDSQRRRLPGRGR